MTKTIPAEIINKSGAASIEGNKSYSTRSTGVDFRSILGGIYNINREKLLEFSDSDITEITFPGIGTLKDKNSAATQMAFSLFMTQSENQMTTILSCLDFIFKTAPKAVESAMIG